MQGLLRFADIDFDPVGVSSKLLYMEHYLRDRNTRTNFHFHAFWQLELVVRGSVAAAFPEEELSLGDGEALLIPPGLSHQFRYLRNNTEFYSIKFHLPGVLPIPGTAVREGAAWALCNNLIESLTNPRLTQRELMVTVKYAVDAVVALVSLAGGRRPEASLARQVQRMIEKRNGARITVEELARELGYTRSHLSQLFRVKTGLSIKPYLDRERVKFAMDLLRYSDRSLSEIAYNLGFTDLFGFSRFFKRISGESPRAFQRKAHSQAGPANPEGF